MHQLLSYHLCDCNLFFIVIELRTVGFGIVLCIVDARYLTCIMNTSHDFRLHRKKRDMESLREVKKTDKVRSSVLFIILDVEPELFWRLE